MTEPTREQIVARLRGDIFDAVPDDNDMQHVLTIAAALLTPTSSTERMVPWSRIHAVLEQTSDLYPSRGLLGRTHPVQDAVEITHRALFKEVLDVPTGGFDIEAYAGAHNDGFDAAVAQELQDHPAAFAAALRAAADRVEQDAALEPLVTVKHDPRCASMTTLLPTSPPKPAPCTCGADRG